MDNLDRKIIDIFPGMAVRKDITSLIKKGINVPTYVLEYLLGQYCSSDDEEVINLGIKKIQEIISKNYVSPEKSEFIKSQIREKGSYTIIDKLSVRYEDQQDIYVVEFANLKINSFEIPSSLVVNNDKLLLGGIWCLVKFSYNDSKNEDEDELADDIDDIFGNRRVKKKTKKRKYGKNYFSKFEIDSIKPIQMPNLRLNTLFDARKQFTKDEWISLLIRSCGYEPNALTKQEKLHYLLRIVPMIQSNYNLVELGPRGTGKSHIYSEISPYSILKSGGYTTVANLFGSLNRYHSYGLLSKWDVVAFDEVGGMDFSSIDVIQILKNYMANGTYSRGVNSIGANSSLVFVGNTFKSLEDMLKNTHLFDPFPSSFNNDSAFFDRIHAYLPGWETPKLNSRLFTNHFGLITDCFSEFCHQMKNLDYTNNFAEYYRFNNDFNIRDDQAVRKTFSGLAKLIYPGMEMTKEECYELLIYSITVRRRVKEQLKKMTPIEFNAVNLGIIDNETNEEFVPTLPEQTEETLIYQGFEPAGYVYAIGTSEENKIGVYRLENKLIPGSGDFLHKNIEGLTGAKTDIKISLNAAFNYFKLNINKISNINYLDYDFTLFYNDLQNKGISSEISVAEVVGIFSACLQRPVNPSTIIVGRVVMSGNMMPIQSSLIDILMIANSAGAKNILLPEDCRIEFQKIKSSITYPINTIFYTDPLDAVKKVLGVGI